MAKLSEWIFKVKGVIIDFFADIRIYKGGIVFFGESHFKIKGSHTRQIIDILEPGDVLLRAYDHYLGSLAIPGYWSHSALYTGKDMVLHMLGEGITREDILNFTRCDDVLVLRHPDTREAQKAVIRANKYSKLPIAYDYDFDFKDEKEMSCTELVNNCFGGLKFREQSSNLILPDDFLSTDLEIVWKRD